MKKIYKFGLYVGFGIISLALLAGIPAVYATWAYHNGTCSLTPGNGCGYAWGGVVQLDTYVSSTSPTSYICAGYAITSGSGSGTGACTVVDGSGSGSTFNNSGTQGADSLYLDCTSSTCGGYSGVSTTLKYSDSAFID